MFKLLINPKDATLETLRELLGECKETINQDGIRIAFKGEQHTQEEADQILADYLADKDNLDAAQSARMKIRAAIKDGKKFGEKLMIEFGVRNVMAGKDDADIDQAILDTIAIFVAINSGSLKPARRLAQALTASAAVTQGDIDWFVAEIDKKLGV